MPADTRVADVMYFHRSLGKCWSINAAGEAANLSARAEGESAKFPENSGLC